MDWTMVGVFAAMVVLVPYVLGPPAIKAMLSFSARPTISALMPGDRRLTPTVTEHFERTDAALVPLGFEPGDPFVFSIAPSTFCVARMYANRRESDAALAAAVFAEVKGREVEKQKHVEFSTVFADGLTIDTGNSREAPFDVDDGTRLAFQAPGVMGAADLYALHRAAARREGRGRKGPLPPGPSWHERALRDSVERYYARMERGGMLRPEEDGVMRLTWKGAVVGAWTNIPPALWVRRWRAARTADELRRMTMV